MGPPNYVYGRGEGLFQLPWNYLQAESADSAAFPGILLALPLQLTLNYVPHIANSGMYYAHGQGEPTPTVIGKRPALLFFV